jgi:CheY-like chemotaxis protein
MPVMDGLTSTRNIRAHERANHIKPTNVIALTGLASASAQQEAFGSGVDTFMTKPVKLKELGKMLEKDNQSDGGGNTDKTSK